MNLFYQYVQNSDVSSLLTSTFEKFKNEDYSPVIIFSDEKPPLLRETMDDYPVDGLMGAYFHETRTIKIYLQGINKAFNELTNKIESPEILKNLYPNLLKIVILHEIGHYYHFNVNHEFIKDEEFAPQALGSHIDEWVAQTFAYLCFKENEQLKETMIEIAKFQPKEYRSFIETNIEQIEVSEKSTSVQKFLTILSMFQLNENNTNVKYKDIDLITAIKNANIHHDCIIYNL